MQLGFQIEALGVGVGSGDEPGGDGEGQLFCMEAKRQGLIRELRSAVSSGGPDPRRAAELAAGAGPGPARVPVHRGGGHRACLAPAPRLPEAPVWRCRARRRCEHRAVVAEAAHPVPPRFAHLQG
eukprot:3725327-Prymnesium_polylepis.1